MRRIRGLKALVHDAVDLTTELVREGFDSTSRSVRRVTDSAPPIAAPARAIDALVRIPASTVLDTVKFVNRTVQRLSDVGIDVGIDVAGHLASPQPAPAPGTEQAIGEPAVTMRSDVGERSVWADAALGFVNAVVGDHLHRQGNGLDLGMSFRIRDHYVPLERDALAKALPSASSKVVLFVHGLATTEWSWCLGAEAYYGNPQENFGSLLERDLGYTPIWLRYNSGRHVSENGRLLAAELERFIDAYPVPIEELVLIGHSMGGLVARSASHYGSEQGLRWITLLRRVFCLGTPHRGAPLEKLGNVLTGILGAIDLPGTRIPARILAGRSAGIKDLRHGSVVDEDWVGRDPDALRHEGSREVPLLAHVSYHFISATVTADLEHPLGQLVGDLLVRLPSSVGPAVSRGSFAIDTHRFGGVMHHQLQNHPAVYQVIRRACAGEG